MCNCEMLFTWSNLAQSELLYELRQKYLPHLNFILYL